ncbi:MAG: hypothetical protein AB1861_08445 [Cyanobacteriota bacterium]
MPDPEIYRPDEELPPIEELEAISEITEADIETFAASWAEQLAGDEFERILEADNS